MLHRWAPRPGPASDWLVGNTIFFTNQYGVIERGVIGSIIRPGPDPVLQRHQPLQYSVHTDLGYSRLVPAHDILEMEIKEQGGRGA